MKTSSSFNTEEITDFHDKKRNYKGKQMTKTKLFYIYINFCCRVIQRVARYLNLYFIAIIF